LYCIAIDRLHGEMKRIMSAPDMTKFPRPPSFIFDWL